MDFGCDTAQGYYFSHPLSAEALADWVRSSPPPEGGRPHDGRVIAPSEAEDTSAAYLANTPVV